MRTVLTRRTMTMRLLPAPAPLALAAGCPDEAATPGADATARRPCGPC
jgi:hypothetical protein